MDSGLLFAKDLLGGGGDFFERRFDVERHGALKLRNVRGNVLVKLLQGCLRGELQSLRDWPASTALSSAISD